MTEKLFSAAELSKMIKISKQAIHEAERKGRFESPAYVIGKTKGWTLEQVERIKNQHTN